MANMALMSKKELSKLKNHMAEYAKLKKENAELKAILKDAQPVVHAYWIELPKALNPNENPCKCSHCEHILSFMNSYPQSKYCDNCGARMDGKDKED